MSSEPLVEANLLPRHVAIIMDGNGRWAKAHAQPRHAGHRAGVKATRVIVEAAAKRGIKALTLFAFSSENWSRPVEEVSSLMSLFFEVLQREIDVLHKNGIRVSFVGARDQLSDRLRSRLEAAEEQTASNNQMQLVLAVSYGGRWDILQATQAIAQRVKRGELEPEAIDEQCFSQLLSLAGTPPLDLLIRTGGEHRISNFLLWDMAYTELYFDDTLWPDFDRSCFNAALEFFASRQRRFGRTGEQLADNG
ncbi:MAG: polyprenyl diphosphate synthase [Gammaproteobacteria bacterium]|jgi:undecaprenyl diphosphate synthase|nr:polyprenyl diphosphate synthase [Gammaproteobacteria bacterium]